MHISNVVNIADFRTLARRRLPPVVFDYIDGGAEDESTLRANERAFAEVTFRPRQCVDTPHVDLRTTVLGQTFDTPISGMRERDVRRGAGPLLKGDIPACLPHLWQFARHPRWVIGYLRDGAPRVFPNVELPGIGAMPCGDTSVLLAQTNITWKDLAWIRDAWSGPLVVKGVQTGDVARQAIDAGADAIVVSNHGGRQLDGVAASLCVLPEVVAAVGDRMNGLDGSFVEVPSAWLRTGDCR